VLLVDLRIALLTLTTRYAHLLEGDQILLGLVDFQGNVMILLDRLSRIDIAIQSRSYAKFFHRDKIGQTCLFAYDESKRLLAVYTSLRVCQFPLLTSRACETDYSQMQLHIFVFDEELKSLRGLGATIDLLPSITKECRSHMRVSSTEAKRPYS